MIIGLTGYAQSGKDSVANILVQQHGFIRVAFADNIRKFLYEMDPKISDEVYLQELVDEYGWDVAKQNPEVRRLLQATGVGARNIFGDKFWIKQALKDLPVYGNFVFTDVRFKNEAEVIADINNGQIWRVERPGVTKVNSHISETELEDYEVSRVIFNDGDLAHLELIVNSNIEISDYVD